MRRVLMGTLRGPRPALTQCAPRLRAASRSSRQPLTHPATPAEVDAKEEMVAVIKSEFDRTKDGRFIAPAELAFVFGTEPLTIEEALNAALAPDIDAPKEYASLSPDQLIHQFTKTDDGRWVAPPEYQGAFGKDPMTLKRAVDFARTIVERTAASKEGFADALKGMENEYISIVRAINGTKPWDTPLNRDSVNAMVERVFTPDLEGLYLPPEDLRQMFGSEPMLKALIVERIIGERKHNQVEVASRSSALSQFAELQLAAARAEETFLEYANRVKYSDGPPPSEDSADSRSKENHIDATIDAEVSAENARVEAETLIQEQFAKTADGKYIAPEAMHNEFGSDPLELGEAVAKLRSSIEATSLIRDLRLRSIQHRIRLSLGLERTPEQKALGDVAIQMWQSIGVSLSPEAIRHASCEDLGRMFEESIVDAEKVTQDDGGEVDDIVDIWCELGSPNESGKYTIPSHLQGILGSEQLSADEVNEKLDAEHIDFGKPKRGFYRIPPALHDILGRRRLTLQQIEEKLSLNVVKNNSELWKDLLEQGLEGPFYDNCYRLPEIARPLLGSQERETETDILARFEQLSLCEQGNLVERLRRSRFKGFLKELDSADNDLVTLPTMGQECETIFMGHRELPVELVYRLFLAAPDKIRKLLLQEFEEYLKLLKESKYEVPEITKRRSTFGHEAALRFFRIKPETTDVEAYNAWKNMEFTAPAFWSPAERLQIERCFSDVKRVLDHSSSFNDRQRLYVLQSIVKLLSVDVRMQKITEHQQLTAKRAQF